MSQIFRAWLAFAALGAGVLHLALVISSPLPFAVALLILGLSEFAWGVATLSQDRFVLAPLARAGAIAPVLLWGILLLIAGLLDAPELGASLRFVPMAVATLFDIAIALAVSVALRRSEKRMPVPAPEESTTQPSRPWRYLGGLFAGGLSVSIVMTPALGFTEAGLNNPHADHGSTTVSTVPELQPGSGEHAGH